MKLSKKLKLLILIIMNKKIIFDLNIIDNTAQQIIELIQKNKNQNKATMVFLKGNLGAGKTTLVQHIANILNIKDNIISPTFVISKEYKINNNFYFKKLIHIDAYRLEQKNDIFNIGLEQQINQPNNLIFIEWPEKLKNFQIKHIQLDFDILGENERRITVFD